MTLLSTIEQEVSYLSKKTRFEYSTLEEANAIIFDDLPTSEFPVCLVTPPDIQDSSREHGKIISQADMRIFFLDRVPRETNDLPVKEADMKVVAPMMALAREFINKLDASDIIEENGIESANHEPVYQGLTDSNLFGVLTTFTIKFNEGLTTCSHDD